MRRIILIASFAIFTLSGCSQKVSNSGAYYTYKTQCLGVELDGSQTLLAWGEGRNKSDAVEQAKKNAVRDVIFNGIREGNSACDQRPLLNVPNAKDKYEEYFNIFFADGGEYKKYISMADEKFRSRNKEKYKYGRKMSVTVRVDRAGLKKRLKEDGVLTY